MNILQNFVISLDFISNMKPKKQTMAGLAQRRKLSKHILNRIIKWSTSKHETMRKPEVVARIINGIEAGFLIQQVYDDGHYYDKIIYSEWYISGSYCECSSLTRKGTYYVDYRQGLVLDVQQKGDGSIEKINHSYIFRDPIE